MMGGSSFPVMTPADLDTPLDANSLGSKGYFIGSGVVIVIDDRTCMVQLALRVAQFYMHESCGKCTPCRVGTRWIVQILRAIEDGTATERDLDLLLDVCDRIIGKCLCALGDSAAMPVASYVTKFRDEFQRAPRARRLPVRRTTRRSTGSSRRSTSTQHRDRLARRSRSSELRS